MSSFAAAEALQAKIAYEEAQRRYEEAIARENEATITSEGDLLSRQIDSWRLLSDPSIAPTFAAGLPSDLSDYYFDPGLAGFDEHSSPALVPFHMDALPVESFDLASWSFKASGAAPLTATTATTASMNVTAEDLSRLLDELDSDASFSSRLSHSSSLMESFSLDSHTTSEISASPRSFWSPPLHSLDTFGESTARTSWTDSLVAKASSTYSMDSSSSMAGDDCCDEDRHLFDHFPSTVGSAGVSRNASLRRHNYRASPYPTSPALRAIATNEELVSARLSALRMTPATGPHSYPGKDDLPFSLDGDSLFPPSNSTLLSSVGTGLSTSLPIDIPTSSNSAAKATVSRRPSKTAPERRPSSVPKTRSPPKFSYDSSLEFPKNESHRFIVFTQAKSQSEVNEHSVTELYLDPNTPEHYPLWRMVFKGDLTASSESDTSEYTFFGEDGSLWTVSFSPSFGPVIVPNVSPSAITPIFTFVHFAPQTFVNSTSPIGSLPWWRVQACEVKHDLFPGEGYWTARYDAVANSRRPARIIAHFSSCRHRRIDGDAFVLGKFARAVQATL